MNKTVSINATELEAEIDGIMKEAFVEALGENLSIDFSFVDYDKEQVNDALCLMKKKVRKAFIVEAVTLLSVVKRLDLKIDKNLYNFFSYLKDIKEGNKELC